MAPFLDTTFLTNTTRENFIPVLKNNIYNRTPVLKLMLGKGRVKPYTGTSLLWDVIAKRHTAKGRFKGYSPIATQPTNPTVQATLSNANYYSTISISTEERKLNSGVQLQTKLIDMLSTQMDNAEKTFKEDIANDCYGTGANLGGLPGIVGLGAIVSDANTYAGLDRTATANAFWKANVNSTSYTDTNIQDSTNAGYLPHLMRDMITKCTYDESPDVVVTTKHLYVIYQDIMEGKVRTSPGMANLGFKSIEFDPASSLIFDDYCTDQAMWFLTISNYQFYVVEDANFDLDVDLDGKIWHRGQGQLADYANLIFMAQMRCDVPRQQGLLSTKGTAQS